MKIPTYFWCFSIFDTSDVDMYTLLYSWHGYINNPAIRLDDDDKIQVEWVIPNLIESLIR